MIAFVTHMSVMWQVMRRIVRDSWVGDTRGRVRDKYDSVRDTYDRVRDRICYTYWRDIYTYTGDRCLEQKIIFWMYCDASLDGQQFVTHMIEFATHIMKLMTLVIEFVTHTVWFMYIYRWEIPVSWGGFRRVAVRDTHNRVFDTCDRDHDTYSVIHLHIYVSDTMSRIWIVGCIMKLR